MAKRHGVVARGGALDVQWICYARPSMGQRRAKKIIAFGDQEFRVSEDEPTGWFEDLYSNSSPGGEGVPWANMDTHPLFAAWLKRHPLVGASRSALVIGCGLGDDAIELERRGFEVVAFDVSQSAVRFCERRFPGSAVRFVQADLLAPPSEWAGKFDFVLEIYTVQALPPRFEADVIKQIAGFVAPGGQLVVAAEVRAAERDFDSGPPWPLRPDHADAFAAYGLRIEDRHVDEAGESSSVSYVTTFSR